jgi:hypothetical protein
MQTMATNMTDEGSTAASTTQPVQNEGLKDKATRSMHELADKAESTARSRLQSGKNDAANTLHRVANTLRQSGSSLRDEEQNLAGEYIDRAAQQIERAAHYVRDTEFGEIVERVEGFARRQPVAFVGAAFALGLLGARFLKSSKRSDAGSADLPATTFADREITPSVAHDDYRSRTDAETWQGQP